MSILRFVTDPVTRIKSAHILVVFLLILNALLFTDNTFSVIVQLLIALAVLLHHADDENVKKLLFHSQNELKEDRNIFDRNVIVSETDINGNITYVNQNYEITSGYTKEELLGTTHKKVRGENTDDTIYAQLWQALNQNETYSGIFKNKKKDNSSFWVDSHISPIFMDGKKSGYKAIMFDITDKMLAQEDLQHRIEDKDIQLQEQLSRFEFVINSSRDGFWDYDLVKKEFYISEAWKRRLGLDDIKQLTYLDYLALVPDENRFEHHKAMHDVLETYPKQLEYVHFRIKYPLITKNSEKLTIEDVGNIFFDSEQNPIRITGFHRDVTDQERQAKIIESQNRISAMGETISNIAHQWRQPIGAINNTLNDLELDIELDDLEVIEAKVFLSTSEKIKEYTSYMSQTIDDFRELSSNDKQKTAFLVEETINEAYKIAEVEFEKYHIHFNVFSSGEGSSEMLGFQRELQQVFINILNNAKDVFKEREIQTPTVNVSLINKKETITIIFHDNAGGINDDILPKIFDPYFTTKHESLGTGIGLYMSKNIITNHFKGTFEVENEDTGAKFIITLPRKIDE